MLAEKITDAIKSNDEQFPNIFLEDKKPFNIIQSNLLNNGDKRTNGDGLSNLF